VAGGATEGSLPFLAAALMPAVREARTSHSGDFVDAAARINARRMAAQLAGAEPLLAPRVREGRLKVLPAFYRLDIGVVDLLEPE
jgi:carbonic anhydrase